MIQQTTDTICTTPNDIIDAALVLARADLDGYASTNEYARRGNLLTVRHFTTNFCGEHGAELSAFDDGLARKIASAMLTAGGLVAKRKLLASMVVFLVEDLDIDPSHVFERMEVAP